MTAEVVRNVVDIMLLQTYTFLKSSYNDFYFVCHLAILPVFIFLTLKMCYLYYITKKVKGKVFIYTAF